MKAASVSRETIKLSNAFEIPIKNNRLTELFRILRSIRKHRKNGERKR